MKTITSKDNETIKHILKLKENKFRKKYNEFIIEGINLVKEAIEEKAHIKYVCFTSEFLSNNKLNNVNDRSIFEINNFLISKNIFDLISDVEMPQGILAVVEKSEKKVEIDYKQDIILALDDIQDPGNFGTIIRTADSVRNKANFSF